MKLKFPGNHYIFKRYTIKVYAYWRAEDLC